MKFTAFERRWITGAMESFAPPGNDGLTVDHDEVDYVRAVETFGTHANLRGKIGLRLALWMVTFAPLFLLGRFCTLPSLDLATRGEVLAALLSHRIYPVRGLSLLIKVGASFAIFGDPAVRRRSNYDRASQSAKRAQERARRSLPLVLEAQREVA